MTILIIENEDLAVRKLHKSIVSINPDVSVVGICDSIFSSVAWLKENPTPDLIFMDIELSDGFSFDIFNHIDIKSPVIFTTSYHEYALEAFKLNSIDYLLKPVQKEELQRAFLNLKKYSSNAPKRRQKMESLLQDLKRKLNKDGF